MSKYYKVDLAKSIYGNYLKALNGEKLWRKTPYDKFLLPKHKRMPGRPKKQRSMELHEARRKNATEISKKWRIMKCSKCGESGHNKKTCKGPPNVSA